MSKAVASNGSLSAGWLKEIAFQEFTFLGPSDYRHVSGTFLTNHRPEMAASSPPNPSSVTPCTPQTPSTNTSRTPSWVLIPDVREAFG
ncbi:hypothetical protein C1D09_014720 [Mesorhizobium intechi]|uniref:Uncharacterized protein n=1 Tax=Mesorhizobium intechi TaxID=537601 RepID=A0A8T9APZ0_9HYPH|nr:hypothetical protein [Mesorhizobium intechi]TSE10599.1 hypothetical protein C1D09_014720 [Mesorhizobium intechi]